MAEPGRLPGSGASRGSGACRFQESPLGAVADTIARGSMYKEAAASVGTAAAAKHAQLAEVARRLRREHTALKQHNHKLAQDLNAARLSREHERASASTYSGLTQMFGSMNDLARTFAGTPRASSSGLATAAVTPHDAATPRKPSSASPGEDTRRCLEMS